MPNLIVTPLIIYIIMYALPKFKGIFFTNPSFCLQYAELVPAKAPYQAILKAKLRPKQVSVSMFLINLLTGQIGGGHFDLSPVLDASQITGQDNYVCPHTSYLSPNIGST